MNPSSKLICELWRSSHRTDLIYVFAVLKFYGINNVRSKLFKFIELRKTDFEIVQLFYRMSLFAPVIKKRESSRASDILNIVRSNNITVESYLDIGAGDGAITEKIGSVLNLPQVHATDIAQWSGKNNDKKSKNNIVFSTIDNVLPYTKNSFDFITLFQALHHFKNLLPMMKEIQRVCTPGGIVIIREHDAKSDNIKKLIDIEHLLHGVFSDGLTVRDFSDSYFGNYRASSEWDSIFDKHDFYCIGKILKNNPTRYYYAIYRKKNNK